MKELVLFGPFDGGTIAGSSFVVGCALLVAGATLATSDPSTVAADSFLLVSFCPFDDGTVAGAVAANSF